MRSLVIVCLALTANAAMEGSNESIGCPSECNCRLLSWTCVSCKDETKWGPSCRTACDSEETPEKANCQGCDYQGYCRKCKTGWWSKQDTAAGLKCDSECSENCRDKQCNVHGECHRCAPGFFGLPYCKGVCPEGCKGACDEFDGTCLACKDGLYGDQCDQTCSEHCSTTTCHMDGTCYCKDGYTGGDGKCNEECNTGCKVSEYWQGEHTDFGACSTAGKCTYGCNDGFWGKKCDQSCPAANCQDNRCDRHTGACECAPGWFGDKCDKPCSGCEGGSQANCDRQTGECNKCPAGFFMGPQKDCKGKCPDNCSTNQCTDEEGDCYRCKDGWFGAKCDEACPDNCSTGRCDRQSGTCDEGCKPSFWGNKCEEECSTHCGSTHCEQFSGACSGTCAKGYFGTLCLDPCFGDHCADGCDAQTGVCFDCAPGYYGVNCESECSDCAGAGTGDAISSALASILEMGQPVCNRQTGRCAECPPGKTGDMCDQACPENCVDEVCARDGTCKTCEYSFFGSRCEEKCDYCGGNGKCTQDAGVCDSCEDGKHGEKCEKECGKCDTGACRQADGDCNGAMCVESWFGAACNFRCHASCKTCRQDGEADESGNGKVYDCESCFGTGELEVREQALGFKRPHQRCIDNVRRS